MSVEFRSAPHGLKPETTIVEILVDGEVIAVIYPDGEKGIKLVSAHIKDVVRDDGSKKIPPIPAILIDFDPQPYTIEDGKIVKHSKN